MVYQGKGFADAQHNPATRARSGSRYLLSFDVIAGGMHLANLPAEHAAI